MRYTLTFSWLDEQLINVVIEAAFSTPQAIWRIPLWRPGRYALQEYPQNIVDFQASDPQGKPLEWERISMHEWGISGNPGESYTLSYQYFANQLDAGASYIQEDLIYVNPINLCLYEKGKEDQACELLLNLPEGFTLGGNTLSQPQHRFDNFHDLVDTPFIAAKHLDVHEFEVEGLKVNVSLAGGELPDLAEFKGELTLMIRNQKEIFGSFPVEKYTFWIILLPDSFRHGVEHRDSTVIVMGPAHSFSRKLIYQSFLEICSHEFFHVWNVKAMRPKDLNPYDYSVPQYSRLHYLTEGITTYYGFFTLLRTRICRFSDWIEMVNFELKKFALSGGAEFISLTEASFNSWVNGYHLKGAPNRRISFYTKGHLVALLLDYLLREASDHEASLDQVLYQLYELSSPKGGRYEEGDFSSILNGLELVDYESFYEHYIQGTTDLTPLLEKFAAFIGLSLVAKPYPSVSESLLGIKVNDSGSQGSVIVENFLPSLENRTGLMRKDELVALGGQKVSGNWKELLLNFRGEKGVPIHFFRLGKLKELQLDIPDAFQFSYVQFAMSLSPSPEQIQNREKWASYR